jgi:hypothetical protein
VVLAVTVVSGCTVGRDREDPGPADGSASGASGSRAAGDGPSAEELSRDILDTRPPSTVLGSVTAPVAQLRGAEVTLDVLEVTRTRTGTRVTFRLSTSAPAVSISALTFGGGRSTSQYFLHDVLLEDSVVERVRYRPLRFEDYRQACVCPFLPLEIGPEPRTVTALFPALEPEADRVALLLGDDGLAVAGLPVSEGPTPGR